MLKCWRCGRIIPQGEVYQQLAIGETKAPVCRDDRMCIIRPRQKKKLKWLERINGK